MNKGAIPGREYQSLSVVTNHSIHILTTIDLPIGRTIRIGGTKWRLVWDEGVPDGQQIAVEQNEDGDGWETLAVGPDAYARRTLADFLSHALLMQLR